MSEFSKIHKALNKAFGKSLIIDAKSEDFKLIIFSDHHRGRRDGADDFVPCESTYTYALNHYLDNNFELCLLGDVEEFWENPFWTVMNNYKELLKLEKKFHSTTNLYRIWGNHDDVWQFPDVIAKYLSKLFPNLSVKESLVIEFCDLGVSKPFFLVHGHQGNFESDRFAFISKFFVRFIWRNIQRLFRIPLSTPATNHKLKSKHDAAMYDWAKKNEAVLICGHTHETIFPTDKKPIYFNTGCCSYGNGNITGIEITDGMLRLVEWEKGTNKRTVLNQSTLQNIVNSK